MNKKLGTDARPKYMENPIKNYVPHTLADTTKAEKEIGFKATTSLDAGLDAIIRQASAK
ncbi:MAG: hypothetical protein A4E44_00068 [Methanosaeta sp. PtaB.Bin018]|nr:MAG: hypothetical protein A4E44_00068 [Methanosaeta sp. PtaB.Bin018]